MEQHHKHCVPLIHRVGVTEALQFLLHRLRCDNWYVAAQREHLFVFHLTEANRKRYAVCFECTTPVDKAVYHGSRASSLSILPLDDEPELSAAALSEIRGGLSELALHLHG